MAKKILAVDDEVRILTVLQKRLESAGYEVITAQNGMDGLRRAREENPDLVILDLIMPNISGYHVCGILKRDVNFKHIPVLMLTARSQEKDIQQGMEAGADAYMTKPFDHDTLLAQIADLLAKGEEVKKAADEARRLEKELGR
jgi:DNA-binding response OmpR family regulator